MSVALSVVLATVRTFLNDDAATNWTDVSLIPKVQQAHKELQAKLKKSAAPVMKGTYTETIPANQLNFSTPPADLSSPIQLWEETPSSNVWQLMTESDPLPLISPSATLLIYWQWFQETVIFLGCSGVSRTVKMFYWRSLPIPQATTDLIGVIQGELYLAPRAAALAEGSTGNTDREASLTTLAEASLVDVILANRGRAPQIPGGSARP